MGLPERAADGMYQGKAMMFIVLDTNFAAVCTVEVFKSVIWTDRYSDCGDFELYLPPATEALVFMREDYYLWSGDTDHVMIIEDIIRDGVLMSVGGRFQVKAAGNGMTVTVGTGRAWFDHTWTYNSSDMLVNVGQSDMVLDRIDALVLEVDARDEARTNSIRFVTGALSSVPSRPALIKEEYRKQYPLAYIRVIHGAAEIRQADITNMI